MLIKEKRALSISSCDP